MAIYDKQASSALQATQSSLQSQNPSSQQILKQDSSVYRWVYRPEMQYSVFELDIEQIQSTQTDDLGESQTRDLTDGATPVLAGNDDAVQIMQTLLASDYDPLSLFGSDDSLLLTFERYDQSVNATSRYDTSDPWVLTYLDHLGALNNEDFLSLNLLKNSDAGNVLWEWAFESVSIDSVLLDEEDLVDDCAWAIMKPKPPPFAVFWSSRGRHMRSR